jgi:hypothetical protein
MKKVVQLAVASTAVLASVTAAHATNLVSSTSADLFLFVENTATKQTFVEDTGLSISSLVPASSFQASGSKQSTGVLSGTIAASINLAGSAALQSFLTAAGSNVQFTIEAGQNPQGATDGACTAVGACVSIDANNQPLLSNTKLNLANIVGWQTGLQSDVASYVKAGVTTGPGGAITVATSTGAWGNTNTGGGGSTAEYGFGPDGAGIGVNTPESVYAYTSNGNGSLLQSYSLGQVELLSNGTLETVAAATTSAVPLPAGVWLIGSGLLGLAGIGRRRQA